MHTAKLYYLYEIGNIHFQCASSLSKPFSDESKMQMKINYVYCVSTIFDLVKTIQYRVIANSNWEYLQRSYKQRMFQAMKELISLATDQRGISVCGGAD